MDLCDYLNESQAEAVAYCDGPELVIAGAGSGKTRVLTYKVAYLIEEKGYLPYNILALTFTNKAANEMKSRIADIVGAERAKQLWMGTFHSIFLNQNALHSEGILVNRFGFCGTRLCGFEIERQRAEIKVGLSLRSGSSG